MFEQKIMELLKELPNECNTLDYKLKNYSKEKMSDFIKDIIAMLNSEEAFNLDKYIIIGVCNNLTRIGVSEIMDDAKYQEMIDKINPRPRIETGMVEFKSGKYGYICIPKENIDRIYEVKEDYECEKTKVLEGQAFIRKGTRNCILCQEDREKIILKKYSLGMEEENFLIKMVEDKNKLSGLMHISKEKKGHVKYFTDNNNGNYILGVGISEFHIKWYVVNNGSAHIRSNNEEKIGYINNMRQYPDIININKMDFSSNDRRVEKGEVVIMINKYGKILMMKLENAQSKSHGKQRDEVEFEYMILVE